MDLNLQHKQALVCGSTQGIGKAAAQELAQLGAQVILLARNEARLQAALADLDTSAGQTHRYLIADFSQPDELRVVLDNELPKLGPVHVLVNNTGGPPGGRAIDAGTDEFLQAFSNHLVCNQLLAQALVPGMRAAGFGRILNVISTSVKQPLDGLGVSNTVRGAVANWAKTLANELGADGITVNNVLPGATDTARLQSIVDKKASQTGKEADAILNAMAQAAPAKRIGRPEEVAAAIAFLASPAAGYINGINLPVDGGRTKSL